ncbi:hypothetical protein [Pararhodobacter zhoushanensis]|uniref:Uncharacterized protein n=1 Tax=Pararhodobacter zhoushanensis TaxID=2479545 RepID=A0ABT3H0N8_9RHOB|nr:hypothetical protein [Pararhodobacter zhoushanensis]MCW1933354.1 hypothetical protein [Pararhodobacter zhoushanensis]
MKHIVLALCAATWALPAAAQDLNQAMRTYYQEHLQLWTQDPVIIAALRAQNALTSTYSADQVAALDRNWQSEVGLPSMPTVEPVLNNATADFLRQQVEASRNRITEVILMDAIGLNVAVTTITSDYWQGDEEKYSATFQVGPDAVHFSNIALDESTGHYQGQISFSVVDPANGELVGAMTVGVDAELLM